MWFQSLDIVWGDQRSLFSVLFCDLVASRCLVFLAGFSVIWGKGQKTKQTGRGDKKEETSKFLHSSDPTLDAHSAATWALRAELSKGVRHWEAKLWGWVSGTRGSCSVTFQSFLWEKWHTKGREEYSTIKRRKKYSRREKASKHKIVD